MAKILFITPMWHEEATPHDAKVCNYFVDDWIKQARAEYLSDVEYTLEGYPSVADVAIDFVDSPLRLLAHEEGLRLKEPVVLGGEISVSLFTCARVEREQVFF